MPQTRKGSDQFDLSTPAGREGLSLLRNRGAIRVIKTVKKYQEASKHKVSEGDFVLSKVFNWIGPSGVCALPVFVAAQQSVHYFCDYFSSFPFLFCATYFSPRRIYAMVLKLCMELIVTQENDIWSERKNGGPPAPWGSIFLGFSPHACENLMCTCAWGFHVHWKIAIEWIKW